MAAKLDSYMKVRSWDFRSNSQTRRRRSRSVAAHVLNTSKKMREEESLKLNPTHPGGWIVSIKRGQRRALSTFTTLRAPEFQLMSSTPAFVPLTETLADGHPSPLILLDSNSATHLTITTATATGLTLREPSAELTSELLRE